MKELDKSNSYCVELSGDELYINGGSALTYWAGYLVGVTVGGFINVSNQLGDVIASGGPYPPR